jgi:hypothetical protein
MANMVKVRFKKSHWQFAYFKGDEGMVDGSQIPDPLSNEFIELITEEGNIEVVKDPIPPGEIKDDMLVTDEIKTAIRQLRIASIIEGIMILLLAAGMLILLL